MEIKVQYTRDVIYPIFSTKGSAGLDFFAPFDITILPWGAAVVPLGVKMEMPDNIFMIMKEKSGIATKKGLHIGACVIDSDYRGEIHAHFFNHSGKIVKLEKGTKIIQGVFFNRISPTLTKVDLISMDTERGEGKFGSTGLTACSK